MLKFLEFYFAYRLQEKSDKRRREKEKKASEEKDYMIYKGAYVDNPELLKILRGKK